MCMVTSFLQLAKNMLKRAYEKILKRNMEKAQKPKLYKLVLAYRNQGIIWTV